MAVAAAADLAFGSADLLAAVTLLVLGIQALLLLSPKTAREGWQLCAVSLLEFLAAAASTAEPWFAPVPPLFLGLSAGAMWALEAQAWREEGRPAPPVPARLAAAVLAACAAAGFVFTVILFAVTPRLGVGWIARRLGRPPGISGFSDSISLQDVSAVRLDPRVVARIEFPGAGGDPAEAAGLRLRALSFSRFDGARWVRSAPPLQPVPRAGFLYVLAAAPAGAPLLAADVALEPTGGSELLVAGSPVLLEGDLGPVAADGRGGYALARPDRPTVRYRLRYTTASVRPLTGADPPGGDDLLLPPAMGATPTSTWCR